MPGDQITYAFSHIAMAADDVRSTHNTLVQEHDSMRAYLKNLQATWGGGASLNWQSIQGRWDAYCDEINGILLDLYNGLEVALGNAQGTEHGLEQLWS